MGGDEAGRDSEGNYSAIASPVISVISTVRNGAAFLDEMISSILDQTFGDFEFICVDDGSSDETSDIISRYAGLDARLKPLLTPGVGRSRALNMAISAARGKFLANIDADDLAHPRRLELQLQVACTLARSQPESPFAIGSQVRLFENARLLSGWPCEFHSRSTSHKDVTPRLVLANPICHSSFFCPLKTIKGIGGYDDGLASQVDYDLYIRLAASGVRIYRIDDELVAKRVHPGQAFQQHRRLKYIYASYCTQRRAIKALNGGMSDRLIAILRFIWAMLPESFRRRTRRSGWSLMGK